MPKYQSGIASLLILVIVILVSSGTIVSGAYYLKNHSDFFKQTKTDKQNQPSEQSVNTSNTDAVDLYVNPKLNIAFNYSQDWKLSDKVIDNKGNLSISFHLTDMKDKKWYEVDSLTIKVEKDNNQKSALDAGALHTGKPEKKKIGTLEGEFYSKEVSEPYRYTEDFMALYNNISFLFSLSINSKDKDRFHKQFEGLIASVKGYDKTGYKLPTYLNDNLALDDKISSPTYITPGFSLLFEKQSLDNVEWWHSLNVTDSGSGPNDLNVYEYNINSINQDGSSSYQVNLENMLTSLKKSSPSAVVESVTVKGYKGYHLINTGLNDDLNKKYGNLIFATDKVVVNIRAGSSADASKSELIKIAESMIH